MKCEAGGVDTQGWLALIHRQPGRDVGIDLLNFLGPLTNVRLDILTSARMIGQTTDGWFNATNPPGIRSNNIYTV